jgi:hypothetical protein
MPPQTDASLAAITLLPPGADSDALRFMDRALQGAFLQPLLAAGHAALCDFRQKARTGPKACPVMMKSYKADKKVPLANSSYILPTFCWSYDYERIKWHATERKRAQHGSGPSGATPDGTTLVADFTPWPAFDSHACTEDDVGVGVDVSRGARPSVQDNELSGCHLSYAGVRVGVGGRWGILRGCFPPLGATTRRGLLPRRGTGCSSLSTAHVRCHVARPAARTRI